MAFAMSPVKFYNKALLTMPVLEPTSYMLISHVACCLACGPQHCIPGLGTW